MTSLVENWFLVQMPTQWPEQPTDSIEQLSRRTQLTDTIDRLNQPTQTVITYQEVSKSQNKKGDPGFLKY